ncbi:unnamed protein product [Ambrosiozyma monospora]|uniref:Unnamed protein product n=1 Tax=Ambrosiozyma monospora TaxID=43982 RepID=A0A9W6WM91_AMBMO|nr:unnamed protein product [Ambrosiozyma monospora]
MNPTGLSTPIYTTDDEDPFYIKNDDESTDDDQSTDDDEPKEPYSWAKYHDDVVIYKMISQLPREVQFHFFTILFHSTYDINDVVDMIDPRWYKDAWLRTRSPSPLQHLLRLLFKKVTAENVHRVGIAIHRFKQINLLSPKVDRFISYLEAFPPEYFNLIICPLREITTTSLDLVKRSIQLANDITCNNDRSLI